MAEQNKVRYGLSNVHVGSLTFGEDALPVFGSPKKYPGAVSMTIDPEGETSPFYADDTTYYTTSTNNGYTGDLTMAYLYDWFELEYLNNKKSKEGLIVEDADAEPNNMYLMFMFKGDKSGTKHILYNVLPSRPSVEGTTKEGSTTPNTVTIPITVMPLETDFANIVKAKCTVDTDGYDTFFNVAPTVPTEAVIDA